MNIYGQMFKAQFENVRSLPPVTEAFRGRVVYNLTNDRAYIGKGSSWEFLGEGEAVSQGPQGRFFVYIFRSQPAADAAPAVPTGGTSTTPPTNWVLTIPSADVTDATKKVYASFREWDPATNDWLQSVWVTPFEVSTLNAVGPKGDKGDKGDAGADAVIPGGLLLNPSVAQADELQFGTAGGSTVSADLSDTSLLGASLAKNAFKTATRSGDDLVLTRRDNTTVTISGVFGVSGLGGIDPFVNVELGSGRLRFFRASYDSSTNPTQFVDISVASLLVGIEDFAKIGNAGLVPVAKIPNTIVRGNQVEDFAKVGNAALVPVAKIPSTIARTSQLDKVVLEATSNALPTSGVYDEDFSPATIDLNLSGVLTWTYVTNSLLSNGSVAGLFTANNHSPVFKDISNLLMFRIEILNSSDEIINALNMSLGAFSFLYLKIKGTTQANTLRLSVARTILHNSSGVPEYSILTYLENASKNVYPDAGTYLKLYSIRL